MHISMVCLVYALFNKIGTMVCVYLNIGCSTAPKLCLDNIVGVCDYDLRLL